MTDTTPRTIEVTLVIPLEQRGRILVPSGPAAVRSAQGATDIRTFHVDVRHVPADGGWEAHCRELPLLAASASTSAAAEQLVEYGIRSYMTGFIRGALK